MIASARRRHLIRNAQRGGAPLAIVGPPGSGKRTFAHAIGKAAQTRLLANRAGAVPSERIIAADDLFFDREELELAFAPTPPRRAILDQVEHLTKGWPVAVLFFARLAAENHLEPALHEFPVLRLEDFVEFIEERILNPASADYCPDLMDRLVTGAKCGEAGDRDLADVPIVREIVAYAFQTEYRRHCKTAGSLARQEGRALESARYFSRAADYSSAAALLQALPHLDAAALEVLATIPKDQLTAFPALFDAIGTQHGAESPGGAFRISVFSGRVWRGSVEVPLSEKETALLLGIAAASGQRARVDDLIGRIWPESDQEHGRTALKVTLKRLRARLGAHDVVVSNDGQCVLGRGVRVDVCDARNTIRKLEPIATLDEEQRCELLAYLPLVGSLPPRHLAGTAWFAGIEAALENTVHQLSALIERDAVSQGCSQQMFALSRELYHRDPCDETACALELRAWLLEGNPERAKREFDAFATRIRGELGVSPSSTLAALLDGDDAIV